MQSLIAVLAAVILSCFSVPASFSAVYAQEKSQSRPSGGVTPQRFYIGVGLSRIIDLPRDAAQIFVANPRVANAIVRSPRKLYVIGVNVGQTSVYALDAQGRQIAALELSIGRDVGELQQILRTALPTAAITVRTVNDTIILTGSVDSIEDAQRAADIAKGFAPRLNGGGGADAPGAAAAAGAGAGSWAVINALAIRGRDQVMLKVTVAEISREIAKQLGITTSSANFSWGTFTQFNPFAIQGVIAASGTENPAVPPGTTTALTAHNPANTLSATLQAFERYGVTRILAEPAVSAVSGESAKLTVAAKYRFRACHNARWRPPPRQGVAQAAPRSSHLVSLCGFPRWFSPRAASCFISQRK